MSPTGVRYIGGSLVLAVVLMAAGGGVLWHGKERLKAAQQNHAQQSRSLADLNEKYRRTAQEGPLIHSTIGRFEEMRRRGLIGVENRLDWADAVRRINERLHLQDASFSFSPQRAEGPLGTDGKYVLNVSSLLWHARLLHEGDLVRVLDAFQQVPNATVAVKRCVLADIRASSPGNDAPTAIAYALDAECELDWITVGESAAATKNRGAQP